MTDCSQTCGSDCYSTKTMDNAVCHCSCLDNSNNDCNGGSCFTGDYYSNCGDFDLNWLCPNYGIECCETCAAWTPTRSWQNGNDDDDGRRGRRSEKRQSNGNDDDDGRSGRRSEHGHWSSWGRRSQMTEPDTVPACVDRHEMCKYVEPTLPAYNTWFCTLCCQTSNERKMECTPH